MHTHTHVLFTTLTCLYLFADERMFVFSRDGISTEKKRCVCVSARLFYLFLFFLSHPFFSLLFFRSLLSLSIFSPLSQNSMNLPPDKVRLLRCYDNEKKWELICDQVRQEGGKVCQTRN